MNTLILIVGGRNSAGEASVESSLNALAAWGSRRTFERVVLLYLEGADSAGSEYSPRVSKALGEPPSVEVDSLERLNSSAQATDKAESTTDKAESTTDKADSTYGRLLRGLKVLDLGDGIVHILVAPGAPVRGMPFVDAITANRGSSRPMLVHLSWVGQFEYISYKSTANARPDRLLDKSNKTEADTSKATRILS